MRKKVLSGLFALSLLATTGYGVSVNMKSNASLSDLVLANVEALARNENGDNKGTLYGNEAGDKFCCCPGSRDCAASPCPSSICD